jgi:hypothetical protein
VTAFAGASRDTIDQHFRFEAIGDCWGRKGLPMEPFIYKSSTPGVVFGAGMSSRVAEEAELLAIRRALVLTTPGHEALGREMAEGLGNRFAGLYAGAVMHTPVGVTDDAVRRASDAKIDDIVAGAASGLDDFARQLGSHGLARDRHAGIRYQSSCRSRHG